MGVSCRLARRYSTVSGGEALELQYSRLDLLVIQPAQDFLKGVRSKMQDFLYLVIWFPFNCVTFTLKNKK